MARKIHQSQIELFVEGYLKKLSKTNKTRGEATFMRKTISLIIAVTSDSPCCDGPALDLFTPRDNELTNTVRNLLIGIDRRLHKKSLARTIALLNNKLASPCCHVILLDTTAVTCSNLGTNITITFQGQAGQGDFSFNILKGKKKNFTLPKNVSGLFKVCLAYDYAGINPDSLHAVGKDILNSTVFDFTISPEQTGTCDSSTFLIENVASVVFNCQNSG